MHGKLLVADARQMIVGARNLDHRNFGLAERNYVDCDAFVRGRAAADAHRYFEELWGSDEVRPVEPSPRPPARVVGIRPSGYTVRSPGWESSRIALNQAMHDLCLRGFVRSDTGADWAVGQPERPCVRFLGSRGQGQSTPRAMTDAILQQFAGARESIVMTTPYLVVSDEFESVLADARARGVRVVILTNSLASTDQILAYGGYANQHDRSLEDFPNCERLSNEDLLGLDVEVLIPAALGGVITAENADKVKAPVIIEAANEPVRPEADEALRARGATILEPRRDGLTAEGDLMHSIESAPPGPRQRVLWLSTIAFTVSPAASGK